LQVVPAGPWRVAGDEDLSVAAERGTPGEALSAGIAVVVGGGAEGSSTVGVRAPAEGEGDSRCLRACRAGWRRGRWGTPLAPVLQPETTATSTATSIPTKRMSAR
jgi:hypothetical protein